jgi:hypothetical protein
MVSQHPLVAHVSRPAIAQALYQSAVELADSFGHAAKIVAQIQQVKQVGMKAVAEAVAERVQQLEAGASGPNDYGAKPSAAASKL